MNNILNYILSFQTNADKVTASINRLDTATINVSKAAIKVDNAFVKTLNNINERVKTIQLSSFIQNIQATADGLDSVSDPGLKLNASLADLSAITDVTGPKLKEIERYARQSAKTFGGDAADGVESYKLILSQLTPEIAQVPEALQGMGNHVKTLSETMAGDTVAATEVLTTAMNQYGVSLDDPVQASKEMEIMMNIMAAAAKEGSAELPQQKAALEQSGMAAKAANVQFAETAAAIQVLDKAGKKGSEGGVALRNTLAVLSQGRFLPKDVQKELQAAGIDIGTLTDKSLTLADRLKPLRGVMNDSALITKLFGKENSNAALALIQGIDEQERLTQAVTGTNTAHEQAAIVMESRAEKNARLKARIDDFKISLFNVTGGTLGYAQVLGDTARDVSNLIPLFGGFGKVIKFVTNAEKMQALWTNIVTIATGGWSKAQAILNVMLSPVYLIPAVIIAIVAAIAYVIYKTEGWGKAWKHTVQGAKYLWQSYVEFTKANFNLMVQSVMIGIDKIKLGWYKFKEAVGMGDSSKNQEMIAKINEDVERRKESIKEGYKKMEETALKAKEEFVNAGQSLKWKKKATGDEKEEGILEQLGLTGSGQVPGKKPIGGSGSGPGTKTNKDIATGGRKNTTITINLKSLIEALTIKGDDFKQNARQMQEQSTDALLRTLAMATTAGS